MTYEELRDKSSGEIADIAARKVMEWFGGVNFWYDKEMDEAVYYRMDAEFISNTHPIWNPCKNIEQAAVLTKDLLDDGYIFRVAMQKDCYSCVVECDGKFVTEVLTDTETKARTYAAVIAATKEVVITIEINEWES